MTGRDLLILVVAAGVLFAVVQCARDPRRTALPFATTDLSSVEAELAKLPDEERALVEAYVKRSNGDVLPAQFADPDQPFTARSFSEAIALERDWKIKAAAMEKGADELRARRDARVAPLKAIVRASVVKAEILTRNEIQARSDPDFYQRPYQVDKSEAFVARIRIENLGNERILSMSGSLKARDTESYLPMDLCWIDLGTGRELEPRQTLELDCGHPHRGADAQQIAFVRNPGTRFTVEWEPHRIKLADGRELDAGL